MGGGEAPAILRGRPSTHLRWVNETRAVRHSQPPPRESRLRRLSLQAALILVLSLATTLAAWRWTAQQGDTLEQIRFGLIADEVVSELRNRMDGYRQLLQSGVALMEASARVERGEWARFVARMELDSRYPGTLGMGFAVKVTSGDWAAHVAAVRAEGFGQYAITPPGPREVAYPILYLEPFSGRNLRAFGYDMFSEPIRREAMARARDSGQPALSGRVVLVQETERDVQPGVLLYTPLYGEPVPADPRQRSRAIQGFVYSPLRMGDLARAVLGERLQRLCVRIYDQRADAGSLLFANEACRPGDYRTERRLEVFGRQWVIHMQSTPHLDISIDSRRSKLILGAGAVISLLLVWAVMAMLAERRRRFALDRALVELEVARAEAAGASAAKGRFLAAASHDLRQPLQSLGLYLHLMMEEKGEVGPVQRAAQQAYDATARLVEALFDAAALESGRAKPALSRFDMAELIEHVVNESQAEAKMRGLCLRGRSCHVEVETDRVMMERILRNLISNALKYTIKGGVLVACRKAGGTVRIKVSDSGPGIPPDKRDLIFEDFFQLENPERDPRKGLGLGLATVSRLVRLLDFELQVLSRQGLGSTFVVVLPVAPPSC